MNLNKTLHQKNLTGYLIYANNELMPKLSQKGSPRFGEAGAAHLLVPILLLIGILATFYLVQNPVIFKPKADFKSDPSQAISVNGKQCKNNECEVDSNSVELKIDVNGLNQ